MAHEVGGWLSHNLPMPSALPSSPRRRVGPIQNVSGVRA